MPAESSHALPTAFRPALDQRRRSERRACSVMVSLRSGAGDISATLTDLSVEGIGLRIDGGLALRPGTRLILVHPQIGEVPCVIRWSMPPRYGAEFQASHPALAGVRSLYDSLPRQPGDLT